MALVSLAGLQPDDGKAPMEVADVNNQVNELLNEFNGNIDNNNIKESGVARTNLAAEIKLSLLDGWTPAAESWTYASATTITVPSGAASKYSVGDKIKLTQTTAKYFYIVTVADTLLTVTGGADYTVANAAITSPYYSKASSPVGFPQWFNHNTGQTGITIGNGTLIRKFQISGRAVNETTKFVHGSTTSVTGDILWTLPVVPVTADDVAVGSVWATDVGVKYYIGAAFITSGAGVTSAGNDVGGKWNVTTPFTWADGDKHTHSVTYEI